jgi:hypothetical protein
MTIATDSHHNRQVKTSGIYIPWKKLSFRAIQEDIRKKNFARKEAYISLASFLRGHIGHLT